jgi:hypothetical protein
MCFSYLLSQCWLRLVLLLFSEAHFQVLDISRWAGGLRFCALLRGIFFSSFIRHPQRNVPDDTTVNELNGQHRQEKKNDQERLFPVSDSIYGLYW